MPLIEIAPDNDRIAIHNAVKVFSDVIGSKPNKLVARHRVKELARCLQVSSVDLK